MEYGLKEVGFKCRRYYQGFLLIIRFNIQERIHTIYVYWVQYCNGSKIYNCMVILYFLMNLYFLHVQPAHEESFIKVGYYNNYK